LTLVKSFLALECFSRFSRDNPDIIKAKMKNTLTSAKISLDQDVSLQVCLVHEQLVNLLDHLVVLFQMLEA